MSGINRLEIPAKRRKSKMIFEAHFNSSPETQEKTKKELAYTLGRIGMFD